MSKVILNKKVLINGDISTLTGAIREAKKSLNEDEKKIVLNDMRDGDIGYVFLDGNTISDLIVIEDGRFRERTDKEWNQYFNNFIINQKNYENSICPAFKKADRGESKTTGAYQIKGRHWSF